MIGPSAYTYPSPIWYSRLTRRGEICPVAGSDTDPTSALGSRAAAALGSPTKRRFGLSSSVLALGPQPNAKVAGLRCVCRLSRAPGSLERPPSRNPSALVTDRDCGATALHSN